MAGYTVQQAMKMEDVNDSVYHIFRYMYSLQPGFKEETYKALVAGLARLLLSI